MDLLCVVLLSHTGMTPLSYLMISVFFSVCMTSVATTVAIGMMPLNLFIYSRAFTTVKLSVPYVKIIIGLALILVPGSIGMLILRKLPKIARVIVNVSYIYISV
jgi:sodium/bile acid cotransporter 2